MEPQTPHRVRVQDGQRASVFVGVEAGDIIGRVVGRVVQQRHVGYRRLELLQEVGTIERERCSKRRQEFVGHHIACRPVPKHHLAHRGHLSYPAVGAIEIALGYHRVLDRALPVQFEPFVRVAVIVVIGTIRREESKRDEAPVVAGLDTVRRLHLVAQPKEVLDGGAHVGEQGLVNTVAGDGHETDL